MLINALAGHVCAHVHGTACAFPQFVSCPPCPTIPLLLPPSHPINAHPVPSHLMRRMHTLSQAISCVACTPPHPFIPIIPHHLNPTLRHPKPTPCSKPTSPVAAVRCRNYDPNPTPCPRPTSHSQHTCSSDESASSCVWRVGTVPKKPLSFVSLTSSPMANTWAAVVGSGYERQLGAVVMLQCEPNFV